MKSLNLLTTGAFAAMLLFSSCSKEANDGLGAGTGPEVVPGIPTYATLTLSQRSAGAGTYANEDYTNPESPATADETTITSAVVLVFNEFDVLENLVEFDEEAIAAKSMTFATTTGKKRLYALANLPVESVNALKDIYNGTTAANKQLSNVCKVIQTIKAITDATTNNNFYMSNVYKLGATSEDQVTVLEKSKEEVTGGTDETANNFKIYIGRMTGKVSLSFSDALVVNSGDGTFDKAKAQYRVRNNPTRFYTFPVYNGEQLVSPYYDIEYNLTGATGKENEYPNKLNPIDFFDNGHDDGGNHTFVNTDTDSYLTENSPKEAKRHKVTFLSIKAKWTPSKDALFLNTDGTVAGDLSGTIADNGGTFYRVQKWENGLITGYCPGIYADMPTNWTDVGGTPGDTAGALNTAATDRDDAKTKSKDGQNQNKAYLVVKYEGGIAYWAYWMKSTNTGAIAEKYALKRNNHYKVNIISVDGVGDPVEDDNLDKEENIEADTYMKATITVLNWNQVSIEGGI